MKRIIVAALVLCVGPALATNKCTLPNGKVEYMDTPCPNDTKSTTVRDRPNSIDSSDGHAHNAQAVAAEECEAAKLSYKYNDTKAYRAAMRKACALPEPEPKQRTRTSCTGQSQAIGASQSVTTSNCVTK